MEMTRGKSGGRPAKTVGRPCGSLCVVTRPLGLWYRHRRTASAAGNGFPSIRTRSLAETSTAGVVRILPLTLTRPSAIQRSASRREHRPARAIALAMRRGAPASGGPTRLAPVLRGRLLVCVSGMDLGLELELGATWLSPL